MVSNIPVGLQLYTLREETKQDFIGTLKKVAALGYQGVEFAGYGGIDAKEMRNVLDGLGLKAISSHVGIDALQNGLEEQVEYSKTIGAAYLVCPWLPAEQFKDAAAVEQLAATFNAIGAACNDAGVTFAYHNHAFEFEQYEGQYLLDRLYASVGSDLLKAELDLYWVKKGGLDPREYLLSLKGRVPLVHVKDMASDESQTFAEVGYGIIDYPGIFEIAADAGVRYYIVEQDQCQRPPLESVKMSIEYLKSIGIA